MRLRILPTLCAPKQYQNALGLFSGKGSSLGLHLVHRNLATFLCSASSCHEGNIAFKHTSGVPKIYPKQSHTHTHTQKGGKKNSSDIAQLHAHCVNWELPGTVGSPPKACGAFASLRVSQRPTCGCGSKNRYQNGTLVSGNMDQNLRNPSCFISSHTHVMQLMHLLSLEGNWNWRAANVGAQMSCGTHVASGI